MSHQKYLRICILGFVLCFGVGLRFYEIDKRMTHVDDIGLLTHLHVATNTAQAHDVIVNNWTYGPRQYDLTWTLIQNAKSFDSLIKRARTPSAIFSALMLVTLLIAGLVARVHWSVITLGLSLLGCSLHSIIDAQQAYPYASTTLFGAVLTLGLFATQRWFHSRVRLCLIGLTLAAFTWYFLPTSYQNLILLPGFFLAVASISYFEIKSHGSIKKFGSSAESVGVKSA
jgi:hypothetical protein